MLGIRGPYQAPPAYRSFGRSSRIERARTTNASREYGSPYTLRQLTEEASFTPAALAAAFQPLSSRFGPQLSVLPRRDVQRAYLPLREAGFKRLRPFLCDPTNHSLASRVSNCH